LDAIVVATPLCCCRNAISRPEETTQIIAARGPLTIAQSKLLLGRIATEAGDLGILKRHLAIEEAVAESPLVAANLTRLLVDGGETFPAMFDAIRQARRHINLEYYIFEISNPTAIC
jgi:cardiolipin synthase